MTRGARKEGLSRRHRFTGRGAFVSALRSPRKLRGAISILHVVAGRPGQSRFGLALPKRVARRAVDRNRMKRLAREIFRRHAVKAVGLELVIAARQPFSRGDESGWVAEVRSLLDRAAGER